MRNFFSNISRGFLADNLKRFAAPEQPYISAVLLVRLFYAFLLYVSEIFFYGERPSLSPHDALLWPSHILTFLDPTIAFTVVRLLFVASAALCVFFPYVRAARIACFIAFFEFLSLINSLWGTDVDKYALLLCAFFFIFLPDKKAADAPLVHKQKFLLVFWFALAANLLTFSMAGIGKVLGGVQQLLAGQSFFFEPKAAALHIANHLLLTDQTSPLGPWAIHHYWLVWPYFLCTLYLLLSSFFIAFRPATHRLWGMLLILYHIGNYLVVNIGFSNHLFIWSLLLLASPFTPPDTSWKTALSQLPLIDPIIRRIPRLAALLRQS
jgi:hypothetical protein